MTRQRKTLADFDNEALGLGEQPANTPASTEPAPLVPAPTAPGTLGPTVRVGMYLHRKTFEEAKSAYLVDLDTAPAAPGNFAVWISQVLAGHAQLAPNKRLELAHQLPEETPEGRGISRSFHIPEQVIDEMNAAIVADRQHGRFLSRSEFATEAIRLATQSARTRAGGVLPPPPKRLPNNPVRV
jgi:hypothetical protein